MLPGVQLGSDGTLGGTDAIIRYGMRRSILSQTYTDRDRQTDAGKHIKKHIYILKEMTNTCKTRPTHGQT